MTVPGVPIRIRGGLEKEMISGMIFDCARRYYSVACIKRLIDTLTGHEGAFLQLHLSDNENVGVECALLGQTADRAERLADGSYRNPQTGRRFLSADQIRSLLRYARERHVEIIPEIDAPAHMEGFFALAEHAYGPDHVDTLAYSRREYPGELDIASEAAVAFVQALYEEYIALFEGCRCFHMGCDELFSGSREGKTAYIRRMSSWLQDRGFTVRMWNDLMTKDNIGELDKGIQVTYWSWDGDATAEERKAERRRERASVEDLQEQGFDILICNSFYLYFVPSPERFNIHNNNYTIRALQDSWTVRNWDSNSGRRLADTRHILGSAVSMWSEDSGPLPEAQILAQFIRQYIAMAGVNRR